MHLEEFGMITSYVSEIWDDTVEVIESTETEVWYTSLMALMLLI